MNTVHLDAISRHLLKLPWRPVLRIRGPLRYVLLTILVAATAFGLQWHSHHRDSGYRSFVTRTVAGNPVHWISREVVFVPVRPIRKVSEAELLSAATSAASAWNLALRGCNAPHIRISHAPNDDVTVREDGISMIKFRESEWCPDDARDQEHCYDSSRTALTHLYLSHDQSRRDQGELHEADIELNGVNFAWTSDTQTSSQLNLTVVIAHEMGHALGLDHACTQAGNVPSSTFAQPLAPRCMSSVPIRSVMYPAPLFVDGSNWVAPGESEAAALCQSYAPHRFDAELESLARK